MRCADELKKDIALKQKAFFNLSDGLGINCGNLAISNSAQKLSKYVLSMTEENAVLLMDCLSVLSTASFSSIQVVTCISEECAKKDVTLLTNPSTPGS